MKRSVLGILVLLVIAFVLTACGGGNNKVADGAKGMQNVLIDVKAAVDAGDAAKAKLEADRLEEIWKKFEDDVKVKSKQDYDKVETPLHIIQAGVGIEPLDKGTLKTAFADLDKVLSEVEKL
jgi:hypothetical protein